MALLDALDRRILQLLDHDSSQSIRGIARTLRHGSDKVGYRIEQLLAAGVIKKFITVIDPYRLGYTIYKTYLRLQRKHDRRASLVQKLKRHPRVYWIAECDGSYDLIVSIFAKTPREFHNIQDKILSDASDIVLGHSVYTLVDLYVFRKDYLNNKASSSYVQIGDSSATVTIDEIDSIILRLLNDNSRASFEAIGAHIGITPPAVRQRVKYLEESGVIVGYRIDVNLEALDMTFFKAQVYLNNYKTDLTHTLFQFAAQNPFVTYFINQIGNCKLEIELEVADYKQYISIIDELLSKFPDLIRNIETILVREAHYNWLPQE